MIFNKFWNLIIFLAVLTTPGFASVFEFEEDHSLPIVYINIVSDFGAAHDPANKLGLASVGAHMMLRGTEKHSKKQFFTLVEQLGARIEAQVLSDGTIFRAAVLSENLDRFLPLLEEVFLKPAFSGGELNKVKKELEGEILEQKGNDMSLASYHFMRFFYGSHPYANPIQGTRKGLSQIFFKDITDYYSNHFGASTLALFGTGAAKTEKIQHWFSALQQKLGAIHPNAVPTSALVKPEIPQGKRTLLIDKPKATQAQVLVGGVGLRPEHIGFYAVQLANHSFGGPSFNARLMQELRVKRGWTYGASSNFRFGKQLKHFSIWFFPKTDDVVPALKTSLQLFTNFASTGVTKEEFEFAKKGLVNNAPFDSDTAKKRLENSTQEYLFAFPKDYFKDFAQNLKKVGYNDVAPAVQSFFKPANLTVVIVGDAAKLKKAFSDAPDLPQPIVKNYLED